MKWPIVKLQQVTSKVGSGATPRGGEAVYQVSGIPLIRSMNVHFDGFRPDGLVYINESEASLLDHVVVQPNDVLFNITGASIGRVTTAPKHLAGARVNQHVCILRPTKELSPRYLAYYLSTPEQQSVINSNQVGGTRQAITKGMLLNWDIPLPATREQNRIVELLEQADALRQKRAEVDALADRILPALFQKLFGDPAANPKNYKTRKFRELSSKYSDGPFGSNLKSDHYVADGIRVIRLQNIGVGEFLDFDKAFISKEHFAGLSKHECKPGDVLIGTMGDPNLRACIQPSWLPVALNKADCVQFRPHPERSTSEYICWLLNSPSTLGMAGRLIVGQTRARISMGRLAELAVPEPPIRLQKRFSELVQEFQISEQKIRVATANIQRLFAVLLHRAFTGDLTAKWRESHVKELLAEMEQQSRLLQSAPEAKD